MSIDSPGGEPPRDENLKNAAPSVQDSSRRSSTTVVDGDALKSTAPPNATFGGQPRIAYEYDPFDYSKRYAKDNPGSEAGPKSRFWRMYLDEAAVCDQDMLKENRDIVDGLLIFAGLFSAVLTTFIVQITPSLQKDNSEVAISLLAEMLRVQRAMADGSPAQDIPSSAPAPFVQPRSTVWIASLWFVSLTFSLLAALIGLLARQWMHSYIAVTSGSARERGRTRHFRFVGLLRWKVPAMILALPFLMHLSLALFFVGLVILLISLELGVVYLISVIVGVTYLAYFVATFLPIVSPQCPYRTPLTSCMNYAIHYFLNFIQRYFPRLFPDGRQFDYRDVEACDSKFVDTHGDQLDGEAMSWLYATTSNTTAKTITIEAIAGLDAGFSGVLKDLQGMAGDTCREIVERLAQDPRDDVQTEVAIRSYVQMQHQASVRGITVMPETLDLTPWVRNVNSDNPQLEAAFYSIGLFPPSAVTKRLYEIASGPFCDSATSHPVIWIRQFANAQAHACESFQLTTELVKILMSTGFFDSRNLIAPSSATSVTLARPTPEMGVAMVDFVWRASSSRLETSTNLHDVDSGTLRALLAYLQATATTRSSGDAAAFSPQLSIVRDALMVLVNAVSRAGRLSFSQSLKNRVAYRDTLLSLARSRYSFTEEGVTEILMTVFRAYQPLLVNLPLPSVLGLRENPRVYQVKLSQHGQNQQLGKNLVFCILSRPEDDVPWSITAHFLESGSPFIYDAFQESNAIHGLYQVFEGQTHCMPVQASHLASIYLRGFLQTQLNQDTVRGDLAYIHRPDNLFALVVMLLYEERVEDLFELIAVSPSRFQPAWNVCIADLMKWTSGDQVKKWPPQKCHFACAKIQEISSLFTAESAKITDDGILEEWANIVREIDGELSPIRQYGLGNISEDTQFTFRFKPISEIWALEAYKRRKRLRMLSRTVANSM